MVCVLALVCHQLIDVVALLNNMDSAVTQSNEQGTANRRQLFANSEPVSLPSVWRRSNGAYEPKFVSSQTLGRTDLLQSYDRP